jgi:hypothetical protein
MRSFRAEYLRDVAGVLARPRTVGVLTERELRPLPRLVQQYVRLSGAVGQPHVGNFRVRFRGRIRSAPTARWMPFTGEQVNGIAPMSRFFLMDARMLALPVQAFHRYDGPSATMRVRLAGLVNIVNARGCTMNTAETVTLLNDLCVFAPGALPMAGIEWDVRSATAVRATWSNAGHTVRAELYFNEGGELVDFVSDDRGHVSADGLSFTPMRWSTPLGAYRQFGVHRLANGGAGLWHPASGSYAYIEFEFEDVRYNEHA